MPYDGMPTESRSTVTQPATLERTDAELVAATRDGEVAAYEELVRRHYRAAFSIALANTGNRSDAEDVCHDALIRAAERLDDCREPSRFAQWLFAIVRNHARNSIARGRVRRAAPLEHDTAESGASPARDLEQAELRDRLVRAMGALPAIQREVVLLHDLDGRTHDEIAQIIGTSAGMSRQHLFKARKRLRVALDEYDSREHSHD